MLAHLLHAGVPCPPEFHWRPAAAPQQVVKMPMGTYEFGANLVTNSGNLALGRITSDGRLTGRVK